MMIYHCERTACPALIAYHFEVLQSVSMGTFLKEAASHAEFSYGPR
jgi:hypothetical protein